MGLVLDSKLMKQVLHLLPLILLLGNFAAGQSAVDERNTDYSFITDGLSFRGIKLADTDNIFWFGDFNYRVDTENNFARVKIQRKEYADLWANDQLTLELKKGNCFKGFQEGPLLFDPTYKYDNGSISYDTSEKQRIPAWTDRILYRGSNIHLLEYGRGEQVMSDHRPVKAFFSVTCYRVDPSPQQPQPISSNIYPTGNLQEQLPGPSTNESRWWELYQPKDIRVEGPNPFYQFHPKSKVAQIIPSARPAVNLMD